MKNLFLKSNRLYWATNMFACLLCVLSVGVGYIEGFPKLAVNENKVLERELAVAMVEAKEKIDEKEEVNEIVVEAAQKTSYNNYYYVTPVGNPNGRSLVDYAMSLVGRSRFDFPPRGDCTSFVQFVFSKYGVSVPSSVSSYYGVGSAVSYNDLQPGDIVITNGSGHVGIYIGGGMIVHNPGYGNRTIAVASLGSSGTLNFNAARRVYVSRPKVETKIEETKEEDKKEDVYSDSSIVPKTDELNVNPDTEPKNEENEIINQNTNINQNVNNENLNTENNIEQEKVEE